MLEGDGQTRKDAPDRVARAPRSRLLTLIASVHAGEGARATPDFAELRSAWTVKTRPHTNLPHTSLYAQNVRSNVRYWIASAICRARCWRLPDRR